MGLKVRILPRHPILDAAAQAALDNLKDPEQ
jgi:hypothetical protein